ncbi:hypothetical protein M9Y10_038557 [Tritrichomonas musculus]|uniref:BZIP domain-containing protein n=1 Tax=Tritrichomonas musculus TaxID=1915356 RepID=A0ABR2K8S6_9EUKA
MSFSNIERFTLSPLNFGNFQMELEIKKGLMVKINESNNTASITKSPKAHGNIFIPRFFKKGNIKYKIISIESYSFSDCDIGYLTFPEDSEVEIFEPYCFVGADIKKLQIPASVQKLDSFLFSIGHLEKIEVSPKNRHFILYNNQFLLGKSKDGIDKFDFLIFGISDLEEVVIPAQISIIKEQSFMSSEELKSIEFETNSELKIIESHAFDGTLIEDLLIPSSVEVIGSHSFNGTKKLKSVRFEPNSKLKTMICSCFGNSSIESISLPENVEYIDDDCFEDTPNLCKIDVSTENKFFKLIDSNYITKESEKGSGIFDTILIARRDIESIVIHSHIKHISDNAFNKCKNLKNIVFEPNLSEGIEKIVFPPSLESIGASSFAGNDNFKYVEFLGKSIKFNIRCFEGCHNISTIIFPNAASINFEGHPPRLPKKAKILVRKNAKLDGNHNLIRFCLCKEKIYYIEDIEGEEERLRKEEEERHRKEEERLKKEAKIRQLESNSEQLTNKNRQLESNEAKLQRQQKDFEEKLRNQQKDFEEKLRNQQKDFEKKKKEFDDQMNQMKSMFELIMKQQAGCAKQNEENASNK